MEGEFEHDLLHLISGMIADLQKWEKKIVELIDKEYLNKDDRKSDSIQGDSAE